MFYTSSTRLAALAVLIFTLSGMIFSGYSPNTRRKCKTITAGIRSLNGQYVNNWHLVSAASLCAAIPPVAMFFLMQKHFIAGLTLGSVNNKLINLFS